MVRRPPRLARLLLRLLPGVAREFVEGDLEEEYRDRLLPRVGRFRADLWFWSQALRSLASFLGFRPSRSRLGTVSGAGSGFLDSTLQDLRLAVRNGVRRPGFTLTAVLTLGLGVGVSTAMFAAFDTVLWRPLSLEEPERLLRVWMGNRETGFTTNPFTIRDYLDIREGARGVELAVYRTTGVNFSDGGETEWLRANLGSANLLSVLGIQPLLGRGFLPEEEWADAPRAVILENRFWERRFGADPGIVGRTITLDGDSRTVVGVLPPGPRLPQFGADFWVPLSMTGDEPRSGHSLWGIGRLREGVTFEQGRDDLQAAARAVAEADAGQTFPDATVMPFAESVIGPEDRQLAWIFGSAVLFVLLIACANVANLFMARGLDREQEIAVRGALGAGRGRILRQLFTESVLVAFPGGALGVCLAGIGLQLLRAYVVSPSEYVLALDRRVLVASLALTVASALLFGLLPALASSRVDLRGRIQVGSRGILGKGRRRSGQILVAGQVAMVLSLLVSAGLLTKSILTLSGRELGFRTDNLLTFRVAPPASRYPGVGDLRRFHQELQERIRSLPGVRAVGINGDRVMGYGSTSAFTIPGDEGGGEDLHRAAQVRVVNEELRTALDLELLAGRWIDDAMDARGAPPAVVVSRTMAEALWGTPGAAVGKTMELLGGTVHVVGVAEGGLLLGPDRPPPFVAWFPAGQQSRRSFAYIIDAEADDGSLVRGIRRELNAMDPDVALQAPSTVRSQVENGLEGHRLALGLLLVFGSLAMVLTLVGVFGVVSHDVGRRTGEMGLRLALGADRSGLIRFVLLQSGRTAMVGLALGSGLSLAFGKILASLFVGIRPAEPDILLAVLVLTALALALAAYLPARVAARVDPVKALTAE